MPKRTDIHKILVIGSGPIVIGQACEFDYAGTQACMALRKEGYKIILINSNPATIMTDPQIADVTYIEPITKEFITRIIEKENPCAILPTMGGQTALNVTLELAKSGVLDKHGVKLLGATPQAIELAEDRSLFRKAMLALGLGLPKIVDREKPIGVIIQYGGQTPLNLAAALTKSGVPLLGMTLELIEKTEDRASFKKFLNNLELKQPENVIIHSLKEGRAAVIQTGYPLIVRPSFVLGGRAMAIIFHPDELEKTLKEAFSVAPEKAVLLERFLNDAIEVDIDAICDGNDVFIPGILEHVEPAGIHSGDSTCSLPPFSLTAVIQKEILEQTKKIALALNLIGLMNIQFAIQEDFIYVLEVNPRASRTAPFISKATGIDLVKIATRCLLGISLKEQGYLETPNLKYFAVKEAVLPFSKFDNVDSLLGPEMKSTGEVLGFGMSFAEAYAKAQIASGSSLPKVGSKAILSLEGMSEKKAVHFAKMLLALPLTLYATSFTLTLFQAHNIPCQAIGSEFDEGIQFIVALGKEDSHLRRLAITRRICHATIASAAHNLLKALQIKEEYSVTSLNQLIKQGALCQNI